MTEWRACLLDEIITNVQIMTGSRIAFKPYSYFGAKMAAPGAVSLAEEIRWMNGWEWK